MSTVDPLNVSSSLLGRVLLFPENMTATVKELWNGVNLSNIDGTFYVKEKLVDITNDVLEKQISLRGVEGASAQSAQLKKETLNLGKFFETYVHELSTFKSEDTSISDEPTKKCLQYFHDLLQINSQLSEKFSIVDQNELKLLSSILSIPSEEIQLQELQKSIINSIETLLKDPTPNKISGITKENIANLTGIVRDSLSKNTGLVRSQLNRMIGLGSLVQSLNSAENYKTCKDVLIKTAMLAIGGIAVASIIASIGIFPSSFSDKIAGLPAKIAIFAGGCLACGAVTSFAYQGKKVDEYDPADHLGYIQKFLLSFRMAFDDIKNDYSHFMDKLSKSPIGVNEAQVQIAQAIANPVFKLIDGFFDTISSDCNFNYKQVKVAEKFKEINTKISPNANEFEFNVQFTDREPQETFELAKELLEKIKNKLIEEAGKTGKAKQSLEKIAKQKGVGNLLTDLEASVNELGQLAEKEQKGFFSNLSSFVLVVKDSIQEIIGEVHKIQEEAAAAQAMQESTTQGENVAEKTTNTNAEQNVDAVQENDQENVDSPEKDKPA